MSSIRELKLRERGEFVRLLKSDSINLADNGAFCEMIRYATQLAGGQALLANVIDVNQSTISRWSQGDVDSLRKYQRVGAAKVIHDAFEI